MMEASGGMGTCFFEFLRDMGRILCEVLQDLGARSELLGEQRTDKESLDRSRK